jgi:CRP-like cAMP-binding protein
VEFLLAYLNSIHPLSASLQAYLNETVKYRKLRKKEILLKAGQLDRYIYFIQSGLLRAFYENGDTEVSSWFMKEGDVIVAIESFYDQKKSYESIQAIEVTEVYYISFEELEYTYREFAEFNFIGRVLTIKYLKLWSQMLYSIRMRSAAERYDWLMNNYPELILRVPAKFIASYLDITEVTLSKIKRKGIKPCRD